MNNSKTNELTHEDFFYCYDEKLSQFIRERGLRYITTAFNFQGAQFWMFRESEELVSVIYQFNKIKKGR